MVGALLKGKYGLSGAYTRPELRGGGGGRSINPGRFSGKGGGRKWCSSLGPKHTAVFNHQKHAGDKMHLISHTHTPRSIFCGCCSQVVVYFLCWMLLSPCLVLQSLNEGQRVRKREFTETRQFCSPEEHQRGVEPLSFSLTRGWRAR